MKGQSTIEFLGGLFLFLIAIVGALTLMSDQVPEFTDDVAQSSHNMELYRLTSNMMTESGRHTFGAGGTNWEKNSSTVAATTQFGLADDYKLLAKDKVDNLSTTGANSLNYSQFREINSLDHQYFFNFTWFPIVETSSSFIRTEPPPGVVEPDDAENPNYVYSNAENRVHYGNFTINGTSYPFFVAAFDGVYDTVYFDSTRDLDFDVEDKQYVGDTLVMEGVDFRIIKIQNRERRPGTSVILSTHLKSFGPNPEGTEVRTKLNRYASLNATETDTEPVRIEVLSW